MERTIFNFWGSVIHCEKEAEGEGHFLLKGLEHELSHCCASTDRNPCIRSKSKVGLPNLAQLDTCLILIHLPPRTGAEAYKLSHYETLDWRCLKLAHQIELGFLVLKHRPGSWTIPVGFSGPWG